MNISINIERIRNIFKTKLNNAPLFAFYINNNPKKVKTGYVHFPPRNTHDIYPLCTFAQKSHKLNIFKLPLCFLMSHMT